MTLYDVACICMYLHVFACIFMYLPVFVCVCMYLHVFDVARSQMVWLVFGSFSRREKKLFAKARETLPCFFCSGLSKKHEKPKKGRQTGHLTPIN